MSETIEDVVSTLAVAKVGSLVLWFSPEANRYENGKYVGRGVWTIRQIATENRASFSFDGRLFQKFDRASGMERGVKVGSPERIAGRAEFEEWRWGGLRYRLRDAVQECEDDAKLREIAAILGYEPPPVILGNGR